MSSEAVLDTLQIVVFGIMDQTSGRKGEYGIGIEEVQEIRFVDDITSVPNAPAHVKGVMNLRGKIISVIDLKNELGLATNEHTDPGARILVAEVGGMLTGILVDEVDQVMRISLKDVEPVPLETPESAKYVKGIAKTQGKLIVLLDLQKLLQSKANLGRGSEKVE